MILELKTVVMENADVKEFVEETNKDAVSWVISVKSFIPYQMHEEGNRYKTRHLSLYYVMGFDPRAPQRHSFF